MKNGRNIYRDFQADKKLISVIGHDLTGPEDVKSIYGRKYAFYMRGHNMFDCFYGRF